MAQPGSTWFQRFLLPGFAFKAVVIGGGYATGRELATFFLPSGPRGGLYGMLLAMVIWSAVCVVTFLFALHTQSRDYRTFFNHLLGPLWPAFEVAYFLALVVILAVYAAAAGAIGQALFAWPPFIGSVCLVVAIALVATWGNAGVERLFKYVSFFLYATYALFVILAFTRFGGRTLAAFTVASPASGWVTGGLTYAGYNIIGAIVILPIIRHLMSARDAVAAGLLAGPLAMIPAMLFFICMVAFYPEIQDQALPSDFLLEKLNIPVFRMVFQTMIFAALLESGTGGVHAINERIAQAYQGKGGRVLSKSARLGITMIVLIGSVFVASRFGLVALIAGGYRWLAYAFLTIYVLPLMTVGVWRLLRNRAVVRQGALATLMVAAVMVLVPVPLPAQVGDKPTYGQWGLDLAAMDSTVKPGEDFNRYVSGAWLDRASIPSDKTMIALRSEMSDRIESRLHEILEHAASNGSSRAVTLGDKVGAFYKSFMDTRQIEKLGPLPIAPELDAVRAAPDRMALAGLMGRTNTDFERSLFNLREDIDLKDVRRYAIYIDQAGLGLPDRDYYLESSFAIQKTAYQAYVAKLLTLIGWPQPDAAAAAVVAFETRIAQASWTKVEQRDPDKLYNPMTRAELAAYAPAFGWQAFLDAANLRGVSQVIVSQKTAFPRIATIYAATPIGVIKAWQAFAIADNAAFYLSEPFSQARSEFRDKVLSGQPEQPVRWKRGIQAVAGGECTGDRGDCFGNLGFGVGQLYVARYFPATSKAKIEALVADIKAAMRARLQRLDWMGAATKSEALKKLDTYQIKVGYADHPRDYSSVEIRADDLIGNVRRAGDADWRFHVDRLKGPVDRSEWLLASHSNDAYSGTLRDIVFPAGILQPPIFDPAADPAINYGAVGAVIGHELTHGFDDEGRKLDADGKLRDWWTPADAAAFEARAKLLAAQYSAYQPFAGVHINGELTLGENIADLGGLNIALEAYHRSLHGQPAPVISGFTGDQRVFLGWAQAWRGKAREDYVRKQVVSDEHSPRAFRVIGPTRNIDAWYAAFGVKPGDVYYLAPDQRVRIW